MLTFEQLRKVDVERCNTAFKPLMSWTPTDWACALAGEVGEAANLIKKLRRLGQTPEEIDEVDIPGGRRTIERMIRDIGDEIADAVIYADLLAARLGIDLEKAVIRKFNEVSDRVRSPIRLPMSNENATSAPDD